MSRFLQLHYLTVYPLSNPNRDDLGRPKSAIYGDAPRLRISSQALKRAARLSDVMQTSLEGHMGARTRKIGNVIRDTLTNEGVENKKAEEMAEQITDIFGKIDEKARKNKGQICTRQLAFISPEERACAIDLARKAATGEPLPENSELKKMVLRRADGAADVAMFGRMLADDPAYNREAAVQVSHALTTHRALIEDDFYAAMDDLKNHDEDAGAGFLGEAGFGSGVFYIYACVDIALLVENLAGDTELASNAAESLVEALATSTPSGKRNAFGHQTFASYIRAEMGNQQPRSLAGAFLRPVTCNETNDDLLVASINALVNTADQINASYGDCADAVAIMDVAGKSGTLAEIRAFVKTAFNHA